MSNTAPDSSKANPAAHRSSWRATLEIDEAYAATPGEAPTYYAGRRRFQITAKRRMRPVAG